MGRELSVVNAGDRRTLELVSILNLAHRKSTTCYIVETSVYRKRHTRTKVSRWPKYNWEEEF